MSIIETIHFRERWKCRVGKYSKEYRRLIMESIKAGKARRLPDGKLGVMVPIKIGNNEKYVIGTITPHTFITKTIMSHQMANRMGWER